MGKVPSFAYNRGVAQRIWQSLEQAKMIEPCPLATAVALSAAMAGLLAWQIAPTLALPPPHFGHAPVRILRNPDATPAREGRREMITANWSGFAVAQYMTGSVYTVARLTWIVPAVSYGGSYDSTRSAEFSSNWVGIGGFCENPLCTSEDDTLIQVGTEGDVSPAGETHYYAWYETLPRYETRIPLRIEPGDMVTATLSCGDTCSLSEQTWTLTMQNGAHSWSRRVSYSSPQLSVEWIEEAPTERSVLPLADFATAYFVATTGVNGQTPSLARAENGLVMRDPWGQTSRLSGATHLGQFTTCWGFTTFKTCPRP
jgi:Peptidase A4 family